MKNVKNVLKGLGASLAAFGLTVGVSSADAFSTSTAPTVVNNMIADVALIIGGVVAVILGLYAALTGLGWGVRKFRHYVSGRKF